MAIKSPFVTAKHDHVACVRDACSQAAQVCFHNGERMTENRRRVFEQVWSSHRPQTATEIVELLSKKLTKPISPMLVYRALDFLLEQGLVHKISTLNSYIGCSSPCVDQGHFIDNGHCFLICSACDTVTDYHDVDITDGIRQKLESVGFQVTVPNIEIFGLCPSCQSSHPNPN